MKNYLNSNFFICPYCKCKITRKVNTFSCLKDKSHQYIIKGNIISFIKNKDFDSHWSKYRLTPIAISKLEAAKNFLSPIITKIRDNSYVLDVGCGDGVHAYYLKKNIPSSKKISYAGLDISLEGLIKTQKRDKDSLLLHANAAHIPLQSNLMDIVFSYGVIAYTDNPEKTLRELARVTKKGGLVGIWIYPDPGKFKGFVLRSVRKISKLAGPRITFLIANLIVPFLGVLPVASGINLKNASWKQCLEITLVNIAPKQLCFPTVEHIQKWFKKASLSIIYQDKNPPVSIWAKKE